MGALSVHGEEASTAQAPAYPRPGVCSPVTFTVGAMILDSSSPSLMLLCSGQTHTHNQCSSLVEERGREETETGAAET